MFHIEFFSQGKTADNNDDNWVITPTMFAAIDSATLPKNITYRNMSAGRYASLLVAEALQRVDSRCTGVDLINCVSQYFYESLEKDGGIKTILSHPERRPFAKLACAQIVDNTLVITQLGTVGVRINKQWIYVEKNQLDIFHAQSRIEIIQKACIKTPEMPLEAISKLGMESIYPLLYKQVVAFLNNSDHPFGYGAIDGRWVPEKFIRVTSYPLSEIDTVELFTDGYFKISDKCSIENWESAFKEVELEDPYKIHAYPATRGSTKSMYTDDRTVLIARINR